MNKLPFLFLMFLIFAFLDFTYAKHSSGESSEDDWDDTCTWSQTKVDFLAKCVTEGKFLNINSRPRNLKCKDDDITHALDAQSSLQILANSTTGLLVVVNQSDHAVAHVVDPKANTIALWNGFDGETIIIDLTKQDGVVLVPGDSPLVWNQTTKTVEEWLATVTSLSLCSELRGQKGHFHLNNIPDDVKADCNRIIAKLIPGLEERLELDPETDGLPLIIKLSEEIIQVLTGPLKGVLNLINGRVPVTGDLRRLVGVLKMTGEIVEETLIRKVKPIDSKEN